MEKTCRKCKETFSLTPEHFYSNGFTPNGLQKWKPTCKSCEAQERREGFDAILLDHFGKFCCQVCGYDKHKRVLECHHLISEEKEYTIAKMRTSRRNSDILRKELSKCALLCANCHREVHLGLLKL